MTPPWLHFEDLILDGYAVCSACGLVHRRAFASLDRHGCSNMECRHIGMREASEVEATPDAPLAVARLSNAEIDQLPNDEGSMIMGIVPCAPYGDLVLQLLDSDRLSGRITAVLINSTSDNPPSFGEMLATLRGAAMQGSIEDRGDLSSSSFERMDAQMTIHVLRVAKEKGLDAESPEVFSSIAFALGYGLLKLED